MKRGFTLIELLAVIVILAIIAVIALPIVLNIISDSKKNASLRSADFYLDAVEYAVADRVVANQAIEAGTYNILENGNICIKYTDNACTDEMEIEVNGEKPTGGTITILNGLVTTATLIIGDYTVIYDSLTKKVEATKTVDNSLLPVEYQQVEYIESTGTQYIDTDIYVDLTTRVEIDVQLLQYYHWDGNGINYLIGVRDYGGGTKGRFEVPYFNNTNMVYLNIGEGVTERVIYYDNTCDFEKHKYIVDAVSRKITMDNGILLSYMGDNSCGNWVTSTVPLRLFGSTFTTRYLSVARMYNVKFYENNVLIGNYIPCYRKEDNKPGMYDLVNDVFYTNASGSTIDFNVGEEV